MQVRHARAESDFIWSTAIHVLDALRYRPHSTHFSVDQAVEVVARLRAERAYFTHICHDLGHAETCARLPAGVELAYDGLVLEELP